MGVREGHGCGIGVVDAFATAGHPNSLKRTVALHLVSIPRLYPRRGRPVPGASQLSGGSLEKQHGNPDSLTHLVHPAEPYNLLRNLHFSGWKGH